MDKGATIILASSLIIIMLGMGLSLTKKDFVNVVKNPKAIIIGLINQLILLPLIGYGLVSILSVSTDVAIGIMILAACPGGPTSNLITFIAKGDIALSVSLTAVSSLITIVTIPFIVNFALKTFLLEGDMIQLDIFKTIAQIFVIVIIPVSIGMFLKSRNPDFADKMAKPVKIASGAVLVLIIMGLVIKEQDNFILYFEQAGIISFLLNIITMSVGLITSRLAMLNDKQAVSISIESGIQNGTMAISIATVLLSSTSYAVAPAVYSLIMFFTAGIIITYGIKRIKE